MKIFVSALLLLVCLPIIARQSQNIGNPLEMYIWLGNKSEEVLIDKHHKQKLLVSRSEQIKVAVEVINRQSNKDTLPLFYRVILNSDCNGESPWTITETKILLPPAKSYGAVSFSTCDNLTLGETELVAVLYNGLGTTVLSEITLLVNIVP